MAQFVSYYPDVIVQGKWMLAYFSVLGDLVAPMAARAGFIGIHQDQWYPQQPFLDVLHSACELMPADLFDAGKRLGDMLYFPPEVDTIEAVLTILDERYHMHHRNDDRSHWRVTVEKPHALTCVSSTPYPPDMDHGIVAALVRRYRPLGEPCHVWLDQSEPTRKTGADSCTYRIRWGEEVAREATREAVQTVVRS